MSSTAAVTDPPSGSPPKVSVVADVKNQQPPSQGPTLLDKLGGPEKMLTVMDEFYGRVLLDPELARFFKNVDVVKLKRHSLNIIATAFSPDTCTDTTATADAAPLIQDIPSYLTKTHKNLFEKQGHTEEHFDLFVGHFMDTIESVGVEEETRQQAKEKLLKFRIVFEEGAQNALAKHKRKRESKVRFESKSKPTSSMQQFAKNCYDQMSQDRLRMAGVCLAVVGVITVSSLLLKKKRA